MNAVASITQPQPVPQTEAEWAACLRDPWWRLTSGVLYKIMVKGDPADPSASSVMPFLPNVNQVRFLMGLHDRNVILKARQLGFCLDPETPVLTADLRWVRIADLSAGDEVVAVDEMTPGGRGKSRKMRTATVQAAVTVHRTAYRIAFDDGREVICTDQHPWLSRTAIKDPRWRSLSGKGSAVQGRLKVGSQVRWITRPWGEGGFEDGWMGGLIDGEGSMARPTRTGASICVAQRPGAVWDRMAKYAADRGYSVRAEDDSAERLTKFGKTPVPKLCFTRMDELFRLIGQTRPSRMIGNRFWEGKELPGKRNGGVGWATITRIEQVGERRLIDLQTSTGTYIANGFVSHNTTVASIMALDHAMWVPNQRCGIIAHELDVAAEILRDKVKFAYLNLPEALRASMPLARESAKELLFAHNNSAIRVATSMRGGTIHRLHISEMGKIARKYPAKATEIVTGALPAVPANGIATIESTAEGTEGAFFDIAKRAEDMAKAGVEAGPGEFKFHFFPWFLEPGYEADPKRVKISPKQHEYFDGLEIETGHSIRMRQRAWYVLKLENDFSGDQQKMFQEMPSTPKEAWSRSTEGTYLTPQLDRARREGRIGNVPHLEGLPVHTFWDIGAGDGTGIWLMQQQGLASRFIRYIEDWGKGYSHYVNALRATGYVFGTMHLPHDAMQTRQLETKIGAPLDMLQELAPDWSWTIVPRVHDFQAGIETLRQRFPEAWFDEEGCKEGLHHLSLYRKKFNTRLGQFVDDPEKQDGHSEAPDALRQWAQGFIPSTVPAGRSSTRKPRRRTGMTA